jgi:magnesium-protoporphyrin IX monomethyl ester (oxidative) cyclase
VFARWAKLGLAYMFLGVESLDAAQLEQFRKRVTLGQNFRALEIARKLHIDVAINLIADPGWGREDFERAIEWATAVPEIVHLTVATPYPGTELFHSEARELTTSDYRLFDIQHAVLPTKLPLAEFYEQMVRAESVINAKFMGWRTALSVSRILARQLSRGQTNFLKMLFRFRSVFNAKRFHDDHARAQRYKLRKPSEYHCKPSREELYVHRPQHDAVRRASARTGVPPAAPPRPRASGRSGRMSPV